MHEYLLAGWGCPIGEFLSRASLVKGMEYALLRTHNMMNEISQHAFWDLAFLELLEGSKYLNDCKFVGG